MTKVAIITRTKDRNVMLARAMASVAAQSYRDFTWVVVNDGGDKDGVERVLAQWPHDPAQVVRVHHEVNKGMEAASNAGIAASESTYFVIHDDDDTWDPTFLQRTVDFLESTQGSGFAAVLTGTTRIDEVMEGEAIRLTYKGTWKPNFVGYPVGCVQFSDMVVENQFAPIALLVRRSAYDAVGGYDATLPVLGDWEFNLRLLAHGDIGVISEELANYHHRPSVKGSNYGNSVHAGVNKHVVYDAVVRNRIIRKAMADGNAALANLVSTGRHRLVMSSGLPARSFRKAKQLARRFAYRFGCGK
jgi:glycosyltransferase involved in cell wall biosynthesis